MGFADDIAIVTNELRHLNTQFRKVLAFCAWSGLSLNASKSALTGVHHKQLVLRQTEHPFNSPLLQAQLQNLLYYRNEPIPFLDPRKPYKYLGMEVTLDLNWSYQFKSLQDSINLKGQQLIAAKVSPRRALHIIQTSLKPKITYSLSLAPFSIADLTIWDLIIARTAKTCMRLPKRMPGRAMMLPTSQGGVGICSLVQDCMKFCTSALVRALNDTSTLGIITQAALRTQLKQVEDLPCDILGRRSMGFHNYATTMRQLSYIQHSGSLSLRLPDGLLNPAHHEGGDLWKYLKAVPGLDTSTVPTAILKPLWELGIYDFRPLIDLTHTPNQGSGTPIAAIIPSKDLWKVCPGSCIILDKHKVALNRLTTWLQGASHNDAMQCKTPGPFNYCARILTHSPRVVGLPAMPWLPPSHAPELDLPIPHNVRKRAQCHVTARRDDLVFEDYLIANPALQRSNNTRAVFVANILYCEDPSFYRWVVAVNGIPRLLGIVSGPVYNTLSEHSPPHPPKDTTTSYQVTWAPQIMPANHIKAFLSLGWRLASAPTPTPERASVPLMLRPANNLVSVCWAPSWGTVSPTLNTYPTWEYNLRSLIHKPIDTTSSTQTLSALQKQGTWDHTAEQSKADATARAHQKRYIEFEVNPINPDVDIMAPGRFCIQIGCRSPDQEDTCAPDLGTGSLAYV